MLTMCNSKVRIKRDLRVESKRNPHFGPLFYSKVRTKQRIRVKNKGNPHFGPLFLSKVRTKQRTIKAYA